MTLEVVPTIACNLSCKYCYQDPMRMAGNYGAKINLKKVIPLLTEPFTIFGGDPLVVDKLTLERLWGVGLSKFGQNAVQTNGVLIDDEFIQLFIKYNVSIGLSVDGPGELNNARCDSQTTETIFRNIDKLAANGILPGIHVVLSRCNASKEKLPLLLKWVEELDGRRIPEIRFHLLEENTEEGSSLALAEEEAKEAFLSLARLETKVTQLQPFLDMRRMLSNEDTEKVACIFRGCDPYTTPAVKGLDGDGTLSNCGRTNKDGVAFRKSDTPNQERLLALFHTPQEYGGCKGCAFFFACKGECPGGGEGGDWRNRTAHCSSLFATFSLFRDKLGLNDAELNTRNQDPRWLLGDHHGDTPHGDIEHSDRMVIRVPVIKK